MKKIILFALTAISSTLAYSQCLDVIDAFGKVVSGDTILIWADTSGIMSAEYNVKNLCAISKNVRMKRIEKNIVSGGLNYYCWNGSCFSYPVQDLASKTLIESGRTTTDPLVADYDSKGHFGCSRIMYLFYVEGNPSDSAYVIVDYCASPTGINNTDVVSKNTISDVFPNPSNTLTTFNYSLKNDIQKGKVLFYDMLGSKVKELELNNKQGALTIPTSEFISGLYFYSFIVDGNTVSTKKLIVSH